MADFRLPMSAGAETSSVSFDPRRQVAPVGDDEVTQVTQSGGKAAPTVADTIEQQFGATEPAAAADGFTGAGAPAAPGSPAEANQRDVPREVAKALEGKYAAKRGVWADITKKKADQVRIKNKAFTAHLNKKKSELKQLGSRVAESKSIDAQAVRRDRQKASVDGQMARRLRMQAGPETPRPAQAPVQQGTQVGQSEPAAAATPATTSTTSVE